MIGARWFPDAMPTPAVDRETLPWWQAAAEHRLLLQRCNACGRVRLPPGPLCPVCRSFDQGWQEASGRGTVYTYTIVHRAYVPGLPVPYVVAVVALEEGPKLTSNVVDVAPESVQIGMAVELAWEDMGPGLAVPRFRPRT